MNLDVEGSPDPLKGKVRIPTSKSHTIRAVFFGSLASGETRISDPLKSNDTFSAVEACRSMGAHITTGEDWVIIGTGGKIQAPASPIDVGNSGTTALFAISMAALAKKPITIAGDESTSSRPMEPLLNSIRELGGDGTATNGKLPLTITRSMTGGKAVVDGTTSQYLSSLLISSPLLARDTELVVPQLNEKPYVEITLKWLDNLGIKYKREGYKKFVVTGGQQYPSFFERMPGDFSSATFFLIMAGLPGAEIDLLGLDMSDIQGDKKVIEYLKKMGAKIRVAGKKISVKGQKLKGVELDLNSTPDALPAMAVAGALADGTTKLYNVAQARIKETDRIAVMARELAKLGAVVEEIPDGLIIHGGKSNLVGTSVDGHGDHRIVMSLAVAATSAKGKTSISTAESVSVTFPNFFDLLSSCGATLTK